MDKAVEEDQKYRNKKRFNLLQRRSYLNKLRSCRTRMKKNRMKKKQNKSEFQRVLWLLNFLPLRMYLKRRKKNNRLTMRDCATFVRDLNAQSFVLEYVVERFIKNVLNSFREGIRRY